MNIPKLGTTLFGMNEIETTLANALFPKVRQQVLGLLYGQPYSSFYTNEIIRLTNSGTGAVQRELQRLTVAGLLTVETLGKQKRYQANPASPLYPELRALVLKTFGLADIIREALAPISKEIHIAFIYGSIAKQKDTAKSDIDLMLISDSVSYSELFSLLEKAQKKLSRTINPSCYSLAEWSRKTKSKNNFLTQVIKQPKIFLIGTEDDFKKLG